MHNLWNEKRIENSVVPFWLSFQFRTIEIIRLLNIMGSMSDLQNFN